MKSFPVPFCWDDQTINSKKLVLEIEGKNQAYTIDEIEDKKPIKIGGMKYYVSVILNGFYTEVQIRQYVDQEEDEESFNVLSILSMADTKTRGMNLTMSFEGIGISFVDEEPKELIYLSIYKIDGSIIDETRTIEFNDKNLEHQKEYDLTIAHMQIDNVVSKENPIILSPEQGFDKHSYLTAPDFTPFIQLKVSLTSRDTNGSIDTKVEALQFQIQGIYLEVETGTLMTIVSQWFTP